MTVRAYELTSRYVSEVVHGPHRSFLDESCRPGCNSDGLGVRVDSAGGRGCRFSGMSWPERQRRHLGLCPEATGHEKARFPINRHVRRELVDIQLPNRATTGARHRARRVEYTTFVVPDVAPRSKQRERRPTVSAANPRTGTVSLPTALAAPKFDSNTRRTLVRYVAPRVCPSSGTWGSAVRGQRVTPVRPEPVQGRT